MKQLSWFVLLLISLRLSSQVPVSPGGVSGPVLWMQTIAAGDDYYGTYLWKDFSGDSLQLRYYQANDQGNEYRVPAEDYLRNYNFHPALRLTHSTLSKEISITGSRLSTSTLIAAFGENDLSGERFTRPEYLLTLNSSSGQGFVLDKDKIINSNESSRGVLDYGSDEGYDLMYHPGASPESDLSRYKERSLRSLVYFRTNPPVTTVWGERQTSYLSLGQRFFPTNVHNNSTYDTSLFNPDGLFDGYIPELFMYERLLTPLERIQAESYLAIKYGFMLERSFLGSRGQLLWDVDQNKKYNHRVHGLYRDDASGLYQKISSTSYEEAPYYSYSVQGDSYENGNPYGLSNRYKLLVTERFPANGLEDQHYALLGDNGAPLQALESDDYLGLSLMQRKWLVHTNMGGKLPAPEEMSWDISSGLEVLRDGFRLDIKKPSGSPSPAVLSSAVPLPGYDGHLSFSLQDPLGLVIVKFGTRSVPEQNDSHDYGIFINEKGEVYPILQGHIEWNNRWGIIVRGGSSRIRINKTRESLIISSNGWALPQTGQALPQLFIAPEDQEKDYYVTVGIYQWSSDTSLENFRTGGFIDEGNRIDLSYIDHRATEFGDYAQGSSYLLVDRSGSGEFKKENTDLYLSDEVDKTRQKITFNNVFFDTDGNGQDVFTFGYRTGNLIANIESTPPGCSSSGVSLDNGKIDIEILRGDAGFEYRLYNEDSLRLERTGLFFDTRYRLEDLPAGRYTLRLKEIGGFNILSDSTGIEAKANGHNYITSTSSGSLFETVLRYPDQSYQMGLALYATISQITISQGFEINDRRIYLIINGVRQSTPVSGLLLNLGDKLEIYNNQRGQVQYRVNGTAFYTHNFTQTYFYTVKLTNNVGGAYHVKNTGATYVNWNSQGVRLVPLSSSLVERSLVLDSSCLPEVSVPVPEIPVAESRTSTPLAVYYKDFHNKSEITAHVRLPEASPLSLALFDFSGQRVYSQQIHENKTEHIIDLKGLPSGIYILKVFTRDREFTQRISIH